MIGRNGDCLVDLDLVVERINCCLITFGRFEQLCGVVSDCLGMNIEDVAAKLCHVAVDDIQFLEPAEFGTSGEHRIADPDCIGKLEVVEHGRHEIIVGDRR